MRTLKTVLLFSSILLLIFSCKTPINVANQKETTEQMSAPGPRIIIYKTKADYSNNVPVILSKDKKTIVSFPDIGDLIVDGNYTKPVALEQGYWLDKRGINENVAFLSYTYEQYSNFDKTPRVEELYSKIIAKRPLKRMYKGGTLPRDIDITEKLNAKILNKDFSDFVRLK